MNKLDLLFTHKNENLLSVYFTAGFPALTDTSNIILALQESGVDLIEVGVPFSDPLADGPTIQQSNLQAIENGITLDKIFTQLAEIKTQIHIPIVLMSYLNPILQMGMETFCMKCHEVGVSGVILPDLPPELFEVKYKIMFHKYNIYNIFLITQQSSPERIRHLDHISTSFLYYVAVKGITGKTTDFSEEQIEGFRKIKNMHLKSPVLAGFGISNNKNFTVVTEYLSGAIIGSAFVRHLNENKATKASISTFIAQIRNTQQSNS